MTINTLLFKTIIVILVTIIFTFLFKKAAGTLSLKNLNLINCIYYFLLIFAWVGGVLVYFGFRNHYILQYLNPNEVNISFFYLCYTMISFPLFIWIFNRLFVAKNYNRFFETYINRRCLCKGNEDLFIITVFLTIICFVSLAYTFYIIGYIPLMELIKGNLHFLSDRVSISREFQGNIYIRNVIALGLTPILSYLAYIMFKVTKSNKWKSLFIILLILSILAKTYDFSKAPIIIYLFFFYFIDVLIGQVRNLRKIISLGLIFLSFILIIYLVVLGYDGKFISLTNGPLARIVIAQIAGFFMALQTFPKYHSFLLGASFPASITWLFGISQSGIRSGRIVMEKYLPFLIKNGSGDVMNSLFSAEAYANFGIYGLLIAPLIVAFFISVFPNFFLKQTKDPLNITMYIAFSYTYLNSLMGGFVDFIYNVQLIFFVLIYLVYKLVITKGELKFRL